jgi:RNA polymerase sigma-70 factor, ECF subfamily
MRNPRPQAHLAPIQIWNVIKGEDRATYTVVMQDWQSIVEQHGALVWQTAYRLLGNETDTADCFQETFLSALEISRQEPVRNIPALLTRLATMRAIDRLRQRIRRNKRQSDIEDCPEMATEASDPLGHVQGRELADRLAESLSRLPEQEAGVFCLRYLNGMSYRQIAKEMKINAINVGVILHRARTRLRNMLNSVHSGKDEVCRERP